MSDQKIKVGITCGDPNGIGYEVVIKSLADVRMYDMFTPVLYGLPKVVAYYKNSIPECENFSPASVASARDARPKRANIVTCGGEFKAEPGIQSKEAGAVAVAALRTAIADLKNGSIDVLVTAPINKENVQGEGFDFTGHTEFLAAELGGQPLMMMCSQLLKVGLVTIHVPVSKVSGMLTKELIIQRLKSLRQTLIQDFSIVEPRIAVLSLNPHAGDGGLLGDEEKNIIKPALEEAASKNILAFGPFSADGFFAAGSYSKYDAVLAMYHDQGLVPFKTLTPDGVNFTAGLSAVRTSPDHGVAYDIAGKNLANPESMRQAIYMAIDVLGSRKTYKEISKNPLRHYERERGGKDLSVRDLLPEE